MEAILDKTAVFGLTDEGFLADSCFRRFKKLRVSITGSCNFRCLYCGGSANRQSSSSSGILRPDEIITICKNLCNCGIDEIKLTGGEPTVRHDLKTIVSGLSQLPLKKLGMTTNGLLVKPLLSFLATTSCRHLNFSLDTLKPDRFETITGSPHHMEVVDTIRSAADRGFRVKINMVLIKGLNDDEVLDYIEFSENYGIEVRFLELMRIGPDPAWSAGHFIPAQTIIDRIKERYTLVSRQSSSDSTSCNFQTDSNALIGFIAAESKPFCSACSRLRLTAQGMLRPCLMDDHEVRIAGRAPRHYPEILKRMLTEKPVIGMRRSRRSMCFIGG